jgi:hypothetical protein
LYLRGMLEDMEDAIRQAVEEIQFQPGNSKG